MNSSTWILLLVALVALVAIDKLGLVDKLMASGSSAQGFPYRKSKQLLTHAELAFYGALSQAVANQYIISFKVRLEDAIYVPSKTNNRQAYRNRIKSRHLDFLLCHAGTLEPALAIELDDGSHRWASRQERDAFVNQALRAAGLPIMRVSVRQAYDTRGLAAGIAASIEQTPVAARGPSPMR